MALKTIGGKLLLHKFGGTWALTEDEDICDCECGEGIPACGCDNLPTTLYLYDSDDVFLTELVYTTAMANVPDTPPGWEKEYDGGTVEFWCVQLIDGYYWFLDDQEGGGSDGIPVVDCEGVLATFPSTLMGEVYVSTVPPP